MRPRHLLFLSTSILFLAATIVPMHAQAATYDTKTFLSKPDAGTGKNALNAYLDEPQGFDMGSDGDIYVTDSTNNVIERIDKKTNKLTNVAGSGLYGLRNGAAKDAQFKRPTDLAVRGTDIYVTDTENNVVRLIHNGIIATFLDGLKLPRGIEVNGDTLYISDTGNNQILSVNRVSKTRGTLVGGLNVPTKLTYCPSVDSIIFVNEGERTVRALNLGSRKLSEPLISDLEDVGGVYCDGKVLYIASSYSIGVFNQIFRLKLSDDASKALAKKRLSLMRETEHLNFPSDILLRSDKLRWEDFYTWEKSLLYEDNEESDGTTTAQKRKNTLRKKHATRRGLARNTASELQCLPTKLLGEETAQDSWLVDIDPTTEWQQQQFVLDRKYQGDLPFFRVQLVYDNEELAEEERAAEREDNQSTWKNSVTLSMPRATTTLSTTLTTPTGLSTPVRKARDVMLAWDAVTGAYRYELEFYQGDTLLFSRDALTTNEMQAEQDKLQSNQEYRFHVRACAQGDVCSNYSDFSTFRTPPSAIEKIAKIAPLRGTNVEELSNGDFRATLRFRLSLKARHNLANLKARVEFCSKNTDHPKFVEKDRLYVLYTGGSSVLAWQKNGANPTRVAGKHRFQMEFGQKNSALVGRPKALAISPDGSKMYISHNNQFAVFNFTTNKLRFLAGNVRDSYTDGVGAEVRMSDVTDMVLSKNGKWLYFVDRNNHRIRKLNTKTAETQYVTGAGSTNFAFISEEGNGYQEGKACPQSTDVGGKGCAYFNRPTGIALSPDEKTLYIAEGSANRVRAVDVKTGNTRLIAGNGVLGHKDGAADDAQFNGPYTLDVSSDGKKLYVADKYNYVIREINLVSKTVSTLVGQAGKGGLRDGSFTASLLFIPEYLREQDGVLYWTEAGSQTVRKASLSTRTVTTISGDGNKGLQNGVGSRSRWNGPKGFDIRGEKLFVSDNRNDLIRTIDLE